MRIQNPHEIGYYIKTTQPGDLVHYAAIHMFAIDLYLGGSIPYIWGKNKF